MGQSLVLDAVVWWRFEERNLLPQEGALIEIDLRDTWRIAWWIKIDNMDGDLEQQIIKHKTRLDRYVSRDDADDKVRDWYLIYLS